MTHSDIKSIEAMEKALRIKPVNTHDLLGRLTNIKQALKEKEDEERKKKEDEERRLVQEMIRELKPRVLGEHDDDIQNLVPSDDDVSDHSSQARKRKFSDDEDEEDEKPMPAKKQRVVDSSTKTYTAVCKAYICKCRKCGKDIQYKNGDKRGLNTHHNGCALAKQRYVFVEDDYSRHNRDGDIHRDEVMKSFHMTLNGETASLKKY
jgi:hypothetical protein